MSLQTKEKDGYWMMETFDKEVFYLTDEEHIVLQQLMLQNEIKFAIFDDGEIALSSIKIITKMRREDGQLQLNEPDISEEQRILNRKKICEGAPKEILDTQRLLELYDAIWSKQEGKIIKVIPLSKINK